jgi:hypothetical protein
LHESIRDRSGCVGVDGLVHEIDHLLVDRPSPGRSTNPRRVLKGLVVEQPEIEKQKGPDRAADALLRLERTQRARAMPWPQCMAQFSSSRSLSGFSGSPSNLSSVWAGT